MSTTSAHEEALFADALERPPAERAAFLADACGGDDGLRARLEALLAAHDSSRMELPVVDRPAVAIAAEEKSGDVIGRYRLLQKIGEGGCGVVWMAEQEEPVRRRVALKVIKLGMETKAVVARFSAERQALALMDHPGIAKVLDAGATASGRPFFVMDLVRGVPITHYCDQHNVSTSARLALFIEVCHAIQHAHQKGIIHRDIKPSNVLVTVHNDTPAPKVIDFGIAKATQGRLTDETLFTVFDQFIGTPVYMSPEQAEMTALDIDTRSDVYSLGVLLYELLAGQPPFDPKSFGQAGRDEIRRIIREVEPPAPSRHLGTLVAADREAVARLRGTDPARLSTMLCGDLDWIVMKALEKDRVRRYQSAGALAADIARHLYHEPVMARPPTTLYRLGKMIRRNRLTFAAGTVVALALVAGTSISTWLAVRATHAEQSASRERSNAVDVRARADALLAFMIGDLRERLAKVGRLDALEAVGEQAIAYFTSLKPDEINNATQVGHANALTLIGDVRVDQARYSEALQLYQEAHRRAAALAAQNPNSGEALFARALAEFGLGNVNWKRTALDAAGEWFVKYRETAGALVTLDPRNLKWRHELASAHKNLAAVAMKRGDLATAREGFLGHLATVTTLIERQPEVLELKASAASTASFLGTIAERSGDLAEALRRHGEEVDRSAELLKLEPRNPRWQFKLAEALSFQADILTAMGRREAARETLARARPFFEGAVALDPTNARWRTGLQIQHLKEAVLAGADGQGDRVLSQVEATRHALEELAAAEPTDHRIAFRLAMAWRVEAQLRHAGGRSDAAMAAARALELGRRFIRDDAGMALEIGESAHAHIVAGGIASSQGDAAGALRHWAKAREVLAPQLAARTHYWRVLDPAARVAALTGRTEDASALISQLNRQGYVPLEPWSDTDQFAFTSIQAAIPKTR